MTSPGRAPLMVDLQRPDGTSIRIMPIADRRELAPARLAELVGDAEPIDEVYVVCSCGCGRRNDLGTISEVAREIGAASPVDLAALARAKVPPA